MYKILGIHETAWRASKNLGRVMLKNKTQSETRFLKIQLKKRGKSESKETNKSM
jgi:hypothetical protein